MTDWNISMFLAAFLGACVGWAACSLWTVRYIDHMRLKMRETLDMHLQMHEVNVREYERLKLQEKMNRERA